jgi:crotonobetainyl-CoA:carnitine CoA-transferase CaiB-like acyl-CoA transferase
MSGNPAAPLAGVRVIEVAAGVTRVGAGLAASLPGSLLRDFGAEVTRVQPASSPSLDAGVEWGRTWDRGKNVVEVDGGDLAGTVRSLVRDADVVFVMGSEESVERQGLTYRDLAGLNPPLVVVRIRPSYNALGSIPDFEMLVHARAGLLSQIRGHRSGPVFCDLPLASAGAALSATAGALASLYERESTGVGGWVETSLYDGMWAILPMIVGRVEHPSPAIAGKWIRNDLTPALSFRCGDGRYLQLWFGAKGAYEAFLERIDDPPSEAGYEIDMRSGAINERSERWAEKFASAGCEKWVADLAGQNFRCEPVLRPGEVLRDAHLAEIGLSVGHGDAERGDITVLGPVADVSAVGLPMPRPEGGIDGSGGARLVSGIRVLDLSAYLAGPVTPLVLAELGADVIKVEPVTGDAHRGVEFMYAAGQRGKRVIALDLKSREAAEILHRLFRWSDVVHHNARVGLAERLGYDEETVRKSNPNVVYSHASGFGSHGRRALLPANDHLMQALCGVEAAAGGAGQGPTYLDWGAIDVTSGWVSACSVLAGLYARRRTGHPQSVQSTLIGAGLTLKSGAFIAGDAVIEGPTLDSSQTGYGAAYRMYLARDGVWFAVAAPDVPTWTRLVDVVGVRGLPAQPPPLRGTGTAPTPAEERLEHVFGTRSAAAWVAALRAARVPAEVVVEVDRAGFIARFMDDPVNRQLGRVVEFDWGARGRLEQPAFPARLGPEPRPDAPTQIPPLGAHTAEVLAALGFEPREIAVFAVSSVTNGPVSAASAEPVT